MTTRPTILGGLLLALTGGCTAPVESVGPAPLWGPPLADDHDPDPDVVEVHLLAGPAFFDFGRSQDTPLWSYNGMFPGPVIRLEHGQRLRVDILNALPDDHPTTLHWHGMRVDNEVDGVALVQDPVEPGGSQVIEFVPPDPGTYWYHPHIRSAEQVGRGLYGAILVNEAEPLPVDQERLFVLDDLDITPDGELAPWELEGGSLDAELGRLGNTIFVNGQDALAAPLRAPTHTGAVERWRLLNAANARTMYLEIHGAEWRVIARDGTLLPEPYQADAVDLAAGQRVDVEVLPGREDVELSIVFEPAPDRRYRHPLYVGETDGIGAAASDFIHFEAPPLPEITEPTDELSLVLGGELDDSTTVWSINDQVWGDPSCEGDACWMETPWNVPTRIRIENDTDHEHPFHIHGHFFQVTSFDGQAPPHDMQLDTILVPPRVDVELFTVFDNPGLWMAHCHILEHAELGMMTVLEVGP